MMDEVNKLCYWYGNDKVLEHLQKMIANDGIATYKSLRRSLSREKRKLKRQQANKGLNHGTAQRIS